MPPPSDRPYRKFDSSIQKTRGPIKDPVKFNQLLQECAREFQTHLMDLQRGKENTRAAERALELAETLTEMEP